MIWHRLNLVSVQLGASSQNIILSKLIRTTAVHHKTSVVFLFDAKMDSKDILLKAKGINHVVIIF